jgi:hypothetical protein
MAVVVIATPWRASDSYVWSPSTSRNCAIAVLISGKAAVSGRHDPRRAVEYRAEVVAIPKFGFAGRQPHPHRQPESTLRGYRGIDRRLRRRERRAHSVTGVLEQPAAMLLDRAPQHRVVCGQRHPHVIGVRFPSTGRTLDIGEQKRHHPGRSRRRRSGHFRRMPH